MASSNNKQLFFKSLLISQTIGLVVYTAFAVKNEGCGLFQIFTDNLLALNWSGQFNLDFGCYLLLSGLWIMWRNKFSAGAIGLAVVAMIGGIMVFAPYLLYLVITVKGDLHKVLVGERGN